MAEFPIGAAFCMEMEGNKGAWKCLFDWEEATSARLLAAVEAAK